MAARKRILLTGGTGFLGSQILPLLRENYDVTLISRQQGADIRADLAQWDAGLNIDQYKGQFEAIIHLAGLYDLRAGEVECMKTNVMGTHVALTLAEKLNIPHFVHASTVAVTVGDEALHVSTDQLSTNRVFPDHYATSKAHAEAMVRSWPDSIPSKVILRLGILVGDDQGGPIHRIDGPYHAFHSIGAIRKFIRYFPGPLVLPGNSRVRLPLVPVNAAAKAILRIVENMFAEAWHGARSFHLVPERGTSAQQLYHSALNYFGISKKVLVTDKLPRALVRTVGEKVMGFPSEELEYLLKLPKLETDSTIKVLGQGWCPEFNEYEQAFWAGYQKYVSNSRN